MLKGLSVQLGAEKAFGASKVFNVVKVFCYENIKLLKQVKVKYLSYKDKGIFHLFCKKITIFLNLKISVFVRFSPLDVGML